MPSAPTCYEVICPTAWYSTLYVDFGLAILCVLAGFRQNGSPSEQ